MNISLQNNALTYAKRIPYLPRLYRYVQEEYVHYRWQKAGRPIPLPEQVKHRLVKQYGRRGQAQILIETGTYLGEMVRAVQYTFREIYSIELSPELYQRAQQRFAGVAHIKLVQGDSGDVLRTVLAQISAPCLFWLDGHFSEGFTARGAEETPIMQELAHIRQHPLALRHVILIDDARCFTGQSDYPTIAALQDWANSVGYARFEVQDDIIRIYHTVALYSP